MHGLASLAKLNKETAKKELLMKITVLKEVVREMEQRYEGLLAEKAEVKEEVSAK